MEHTRTDQGRKLNIFALIDVVSFDWMPCVEEGCRGWQVANARAKRSFWKNASGDWQIDWNDHIATGGKGRRLILPAKHSEKEVSKTLMRWHINHADCLIGGYGQVEADDRVWIDLLGNAWPASISQKCSEIARQPICASWTLSDAVARFGSSAKWRK